MFDKRNNLAQQVATDVRSFLGKRVYETIVPRNVRVSEAPSHGLPVLLYDFRCAGSQAYVHLAGEVLRRDQETCRGMSDLGQEVKSEAAASGDWGVVCRALIPESPVDIRTNGRRLGGAQTLPIEQR